MCRRSSFSFLELKFQVLNINALVFSHALLIQVSKMIYKTCFSWDGQFNLNLDDSEKLLEACLLNDDVQLPK